MKKIAMALTFLVGIFNCHFASSEGGNIAVADLDRALRISNYSLKQYEVLKADENYKKLIAQINSIRAEIELMRKDGETKSLTWSETQKQEHLQKGQAKVAEINNLAGQEAAVRNRLDASIKKELAPKIETIVNEIIQEKSIGLLVKSQAVHFAKPLFDITEDIVKRLNSAE